MLRALKQLNSEPVVVLKKLTWKQDEKSTSHKITEAMKTNAAEPSEGASLVMSEPTTLTDALDLKNSHSSSLKRKASLEDVLSEADAAFFSKAKKNKKEIRTMVAKDNQRAVSSEKSCRPKTQKSLLKVKLFKSQETKLDHDSTKKISPDKKKKKLKKADNNGILSYLQLVPRTVPDDKTDDELPDFQEKTSLSMLHFDNDLPRSDSAETVALEIEEKEETIEEATAKSTNCSVDCVSLISPVPSPVPSQLPEEQNEPHQSTVNVPCTLDIQLHEEKKTALACSSVEEFPGQQIKDRGAVELASERCPEVTEVSLQEAGASNKTDVSKECESLGYAKIKQAAQTELSSENSTTKLESSSSSLKEPTQHSLTEFLKETLITDTKPDTASSAPGEMPLDDSLFNQNTLRDGSSKKVPLLNVVERVIDRPMVGNPPSISTGTTTSVQDIPLRASNDEASRSTETRSYKTNDLDSKFQDAFQARNSALRSRETSEANNNIASDYYNLEDQKRAVVEAMNELRKEYQTLVTTARPHENLLRQNINHYDTIKKKLEAAEKENVDISARLMSLTCECEILQKKCEKLSVEKTQAQQANLETEMRLREQQMELCREQLQLGISHRLDESHPSFHVVRERQEKVDCLTREVAEKHAAYKAMEEAFAQSKSVMEKTQKEMETLTNRKNESKYACEKLRKDLETVRTEITEKSLLGKQHFDDQRRLWLEGLDRRDQLLKIEYLQKLEELSKRRQLAQAQVYSIEHMLMSRSILTSVEGVERSSPTSATSEAKSDESIADEESLPSHATPSTLNLNELAEAVPYYANFLDKSKPSGNLSSDDKILCRNIIRGCRQYGVWKKTYLKGPFQIDSLDETTLKQSSAYIKDFVIPLFQLWTMKNSTASSILNFIINEGFQNNWYGFPALDPFVMRDMLETNVRDAIDIGKKFAEKFDSPTSLTVSSIECKVASSENSVQVNASQAQTSSECVISESNPTGPHLRLRNLLNEEAQISVQTTPATIAGSLNTSAVCIAQPLNHISASQAWSNTRVTSGPIMAIQSTVVQNTAVVLPMASAHYVNPNQHFIPITTLATPALSQPAQTNSSSQYQINNVISSNPPAYSTFQAVNPVQYSQQFNQNRVVSYPYTQQVPCTTNTQAIVNNTFPTAGPARAQYPAQHFSQTNEMQNQRVSTSQMPTQQRQVVEQIQQRSPSVHSSRQMQEQQRTVITNPIVNSQNTNLASRMSQQSVAKRCTPQEGLALGLQSQLKQPKYLCEYCRAEAHQKCSGCQNAYYCNGTCQLSHWDVHRDTCGKR